MVQPTSFRVFLSAVSNELASYRTEVARVLRRRGIEVRDQEHFRQGDATLVEALRESLPRSRAAEAEQLAVSVAGQSVQWA